MRRRFKLNSGQWARLRRVVLVRDSWKCVKCGRSGRMEVTTLSRSTWAAHGTTRRTFNPYA